MPGATQGREPYIPARGPKGSNFRQGATRPRPQDPWSSKHQLSFTSSNIPNILLFKSPISEVHILSANVVQVDMPVLTTIRQSPAYLYVKTYCLCAGITLFQVAPASSKFVQLEDSFQLKRKRVTDARREASTLLKHRRETSSQYRNGKDRSFNFSENGNDTPKKSRLEEILKRWYRRAVDLAQVKKQLRTDDKDLVTYPELNCDSAVRHSSLLHPAELQFIELRKHKVSSEGANSLSRFL